MHGTVGDGGWIASSVGELPPNNEIRYTLDGSEPTAESTRYEKPFSLKQTAKVTAAIFVGGKAVTAPSAESFQKPSEKK